MLVAALLAFSHREASAYVSGPVNWAIMGGTLLAPTAREPSMDLPELITLYTAAWCEPDRAIRQQLLERAWTEEGTYTDPTAHVAGRAQLVDHIGRFFEKFPGARIELASGIDAHHGKVRFAWHMVLADGRVLLEGVDFGELSPDGRLQRIVGFFGARPPEPQERRPAAATG